MQKVDWDCSMKKFFISLSSSTSLSPYNLTHICRITSFASLKKKTFSLRGQHSTMVSIHPDPADMGSIPSVPKKISEEAIIDVAEGNQQRWLEESGQWVENFHQTHLVLASVKQVLQKYPFPDLS